MKPHRDMEQLQFPLSIVMSSLGSIISQARPSFWLGLVDAFTPFHLLL
jgi:hypothetical protein